MIEVRKILVPVDGSPNSYRALAFAGYLAGCCQASVGILHVVNLPATAVTLSASAGYVSDGVLDSVREAGHALVHEAVSRLSAVKAKGFVEIGAPTESIVAFCASHNYDLVVIGSRGMGALEQMVLGSVSSYVLHHAPCPVTIVR